MPAGRAGGADAGRFTRRIIRGALGGWLLLVALSTLWEVRLLRRTAIEMAVADGNSSIEKDLAYRRWAAMHGGVYVRPTERTPPSPYLAHLPDRDVVTTSGIKLTLLNPAYMTREVHELARGAYTGRGHITSLNPLRPENAPDAWEAEALARFAAGAKTALTVATQEGREEVRVMHPLFAEKPCLACHGKQGYREGDLRGGISVRVDAAPYFAAADGERWRLGVVNGLLGLLGLLAIAWAGSRLLRYEASVREQAQRLGLALQGASLASWDWRASGGGFVYDERWRELVGHGGAAAELAPPAWEALIHPDDRAAVEAARAAHLAGEAETLRSEHRLRHRSGRWVWVLETGRVIERDPAGRALRACGTVLDVTAQREADAKVEEGRAARALLEEELRQSQRVESIGRLAGGVAHDLNNLLCPILSYGGLLTRELPAGGEPREFAEEIVLAGRRARELVQQLLAFGRRQVLSVRPVSLEEILREFEKLLRRTIREDVAIELRCAPDVGPILADRGQIEQVIMNLAVNAGDAMPEGGRLTLVTRGVRLEGREEAERLGVAPGPYALLEVVDTGTGMEEEISRHIFEPFFSTKGTGGTGLGLATVHGIVRQHGGAIRVASRPGEGTTFSILLPIATDAVAEPTPRRPPPRAARGTETILVAEDDEQVRGAESAILRRCGYEVLAAGSGEGALALLAGHPGAVHLLLSDVVMPGMGGRELHARVAAAWPSVKVLFTSGYAWSPEDEGRGFAAEAFLKKPFAEDDLAQKVRAVLDADGPRDGDAAATRPHVAT
jgi:PAS domain S-box-containing protein